mgnify:CR=1 FL=1
MHEPNTWCLSPPKSSIYQGGPLPYGYPYQELLYHRRPIFAFFFRVPPPKISLFSPNRIGERPLEIIVTQGTTQIFEIYPFIKITDRFITTRNSINRVIKDLSVAACAKVQLTMCPPHQQADLRFGIGQRGPGVTRDTGKWLFLDI